MTSRNRPASDLESALSRLFHRNLHLVKLDLEPMKALLAELGDPHTKYLCVHVAGTNGKGSVCALLDRILRAQGYRTGRYTSPHLVRFNERIQIDGAPIGDGELLALIDEVERAAAALPAKGLRDVTFFEFTTAIAYLHFARAGVGIAVIETGMGGRLDATNVIHPAVSVITSIGFDHMAYLGDTLEKIAAEKAGIIKPGRPVVIGSLPEEAAAVIAARAAAVGAPLIVASDQVSVAVRSVSLHGQSLDVSSEQAGYGRISMRLPGLHQAGNAAVAVAVAECLDGMGVALGEAAIRTGLAEAEWPARGQLLAEDPPTILDGAHNPEAAAALVAWLKKAAGRKPLGLVVGFLSDKDPAAFLKHFGARVQRVWVVPIQSERAMPVEEVVARLARPSGVAAVASLAEGLEQARAWAAAEGGVVVITGSLYLAGEVLALASGAPSSGN